MKIPIENVPHHVAHCRDVAKRAREEFTEMLKKADAETDPELKEKWQEQARSALDVATSHEADADELTEKFIAAGGQIHKLQ